MEADLIIVQGPVKTIFIHVRIAGKLLNHRQASLLAFNFYRAMLYFGDLVHFIKESNEFQICPSIAAYSSCKLWSEKQQPLTSSHYDLVGIESFSLDGYGLAHIKQGDEESLTIATTPEALAHITVKKTGSALTIKVATETMPKPHPDITFNVTAKMLTSLTLQGGIDFDLALAHAKTFNFKAALGPFMGQSSYRCKGSSFTLMEASITIQGTAPVQRITLLGSTQYDAQNLMSETCSIEALGATSCTLQCTEKIEGAVSGASSLYYKGDPTMHVQTLGASVVRKLT